MVHIECIKDLQSRISFTGPKNKVPTPQPEVANAMAVECRESPMKLRLTANSGVTNSTDAAKPGIPTIRNLPHGLLLHVKRPSVNYFAIVKKNTIEIENVPKVISQRKGES